MTKLTNRVVMVTGASRGLGKALVELFLTHDIKRIYATARSSSSLPAFSDHRVMPIALDIGDAEQIETIAVQATDVDILVNNVGINLFGSILTTPLEHIEQEFAVNLFGTLNMVRAFYPVISANGGGNIVNLNSICSFAAMPGLAGYSASKAALFSITQAMRPELAEVNIKVHGVFPGPIDTNMNAGKDVPDMASAHDVAHSIVQGILDGDDDIYPDRIGQQTADEWHANPKQVEQKFAQYR